MFGETLRVKLHFLVESGAFHDVINDQLTYIYMFTLGMHDQYDSQSQELR